MKPAPSYRLTRTVVVLGVVSLLTDVASDMAVPFLPIFLTTVLHADTTWVGLIDGLAESTASLMKYVAGVAADRFPRKKPLVLAGYGLSSLARPFLALAAAPWMVLAVRFLDRVGKGVRTSPRDALIARDTPPDQRAYAFGFHRGMDNLGAVFGPLLAAGILFLAPGHLRLVFALTAVPGVLSLLVLGLGLREPAAAPVAPASDRRGPDAPGRLDPGLRSYLVLVALFTMANASDSFLLLKAKDLGVPLGALPLVWGGLSLLRAVSTAPGGRLADRIGRPQALALGWALYAVAYAGFGLARSPWVALGFLLVYGLYYGLTEGTEKALVASFAGPKVLGRAYGMFNLVTGLLALPSSLLFGWLYPRAHGLLAFGVAAGFSAVAAAGMAVWGGRGHAAQDPRTRPQGH